MKSNGAGESIEGNRRSSHVDMPVAYAAVGASKAEDLLRFPPEGSTPYEEALRLGSGEERFLLASSVLMTWGAQRGAGMRVDQIERGPDDEYEGVVFDADGGVQAAAPREDTFGPDGEAYLNAGTTATITGAGQNPRRVLVIYTIDEERRVGFAWGTGDENGAVGEQCFAVERRDDDTVWAVARGFLTAPRAGLLGLKARSDLRSALEDVKRQLQALAPGAVVDNAGEGSDAARAEAGAAEPTAEKGEPVAEPVQAEAEAEVAEPVAEQAESAAEPVAEAPEHPDAAEHSDAAEVWGAAEETVEDAVVVESAFTAEIEVVDPAEGDTEPDESGTDGSVATEQAEPSATGQIDEQVEPTATEQVDEAPRPAPRPTHQRRPSRPAGKQGE
ncbi:DUF1990 family protein [Leucobacter ruminantium]|nr:DUF1990 family protein [Leucobacter ruminantium]